LDPGGSKKIVIHVDPDSDLIDPEDKYLDPGGSKKKKIVIHVDPDSDLIDPDSGPYSN
jgi:hypothetical protein